MSRYRFELATPADDAQLRHVLAECPMDGRIALSFLREPSYFRAAAVEGSFRQVISVHDSEDGRIVGLGSRSVRHRYVNGEPSPVGYLSTLRLLPTHRNRGLLARGYAFLRKLHEDGRTPFYLTTIAEGNDTALDVLTLGRAGLPKYHPLGDYHTLAIPVSTCAKANEMGGRDWSRASGEAKSRWPEDVTLRTAEADDLPRILAFLAEHGPQSQFFPCYEAADFFALDATFRDLKPEDLLLAFRHDQLVGMLGAWDQRAFRQSVVHHYAAPLEWMRPLYNGLARLRRMPSLPRPGEAIHYRLGTLPVVADNNEAVFSALLDHVLQRIAIQNGGVIETAPATDFLLLGFHASDPLAAIARRRASACYTTHLFVVCWEDGEEPRAQLDARVPFLELGML